MPASHCAATPLFKDSITKDFDRLIQLVFQTASTTATQMLGAFNELGDDPPHAADLDRLLAQSLRAALGQALDAKVLRRFMQALNGPLPCNSSELQERLANAGVRPLEDDLIFIALYGMKRGLTHQDLALLPAEAVTLSFRVDRKLSKAQLAEATINLVGTARHQYLEPVSAGEGIQRVGSTFQTAKETLDELLELIKSVSAFLEELFSCLMKLTERIKEAIERGDTETARDLIEKHIRELEELQKKNAERMKELEKEPASDAKTREQEKLNRENKLLDKFKEGYQKMLKADSE